MATSRKRCRVCNRARQLVFQTGLCPRDYRNHLAHPDYSDERLRALIAWDRSENGTVKMSAPRVPVEIAAAFEREASRRNATLYVLVRDVLVAAAKGGRW